MTYPNNRPFRAPDGVKRGDTFKALTAYKVDDAHVRYDGPFVVDVVVPHKGLHFNEGFAVNRLGHSLAFYAL